MRSLSAAALCALVVCGGTITVQAQEYPNRTVTLIVPRAAGGIVDIAARTLAEALSDKWGQTVVVENRTGGAGFIAGAAVAEAEPDGYTLLVSDVGLNVINQYLFDDVPYDATERFRSIAMISDTPMVLVAYADAPFETPAEYVEYARANPNTLSFGSAGIGTVNHIVPEWINAETGIEVEHIPYPGGAPAAAAVAAGEVEVGVIGLSSAEPFITSGQVKILGVAREERVDSHPDVPTLIESGIPNVAAGQWAALFAPAGVPDEIIEKIEADALEFLTSDEAREVFARRGTLVEPMDGAALDAMLDRLHEQFSEVIATAGIRGE